MKTSKKKIGTPRLPSESQPDEIKHSPHASIMQLASLTGNSAMEALLRQETVSTSPQGSGQPLPDSLRARFENASGVLLDDVRVHYNSPEPNPFMARAFTKGADIHIAPGEEDTLEHEVTHAVQQKQGRVQATGMLNGEPVNEDKGLEEEAEGSYRFDNRHNRDTSIKDIVQMWPLFRRKKEPIISAPTVTGRGPCSDYALAVLKYLGYDTTNITEPLTMNYPFEVNEVYPFSTIPEDALVAFYRIKLLSPFAVPAFDYHQDSRAVHVMVSDGAGHLYGMNNGDFIHKNLGAGTQTDYCGITGLEYSLDNIAQEWFLPEDGKFNNFYKSKACIIYRAKYICLHRNN